MYEFSGGFTGKDFDSEVNLYYYNARWYNADLGKFISEDPAGQGWNWYGYGANNPLLNVDPSGLWEFGFGIVFGWSSSTGWNIGFGIALDFDIGDLAVHLGADSVWNQDHSNTTTLELGAKAQFPGLIGVDLGFGASYNTFTGTTFFGNIGASILCYGFEIGTVQAVNTNGKYEGGEVSIEGYIRDESANVGGGYQWGWGGFKSGGFFEAQAMGISYNSLSGLSFSGNAYLGINYDKQGNSTLNFRSNFDIQHQVSLVTAAGDIAGTGLVLADRLTTGYGSIGVYSNNQIDFVTNFHAARFGIDGAITLGHAGLFYYYDLDTHTTKTPNDLVSSYDRSSSEVYLGEHEYGHVIQWDAMGFGFIPNWFFAGGANKKNWMEQDADQVGRGH